MNNKLKNILTSNDKRTALIKKNIAAGAIIRGISIIISLLLVPLTINYISPELYGIWLTISSIISWIGFFDIGFGNGLRNKLAESLALGKFKQGKIYVSTTYFIISVIFISLSIILYIVAGYLNWSSILNINQEFNGTLIIVTRIVIVAFSIQIILKLIQNVIQAYQLNALASAMDAIGNLVALISIFILTNTMSPNLSWIALAFSLSPLLVLIIFSFIFYSKKFADVSPNYKYIKLSCAKDLFKLGGNFFIIQIAVVVIYQTINIIITRICGPESVTIYNIAYKYLSVVLMVFTIIMAPMWSAFTDAFAKKDYVWMNNIYKKLLNLYWLSIIGLIVIVIISPIVYKLWIGDQVSISMTISILVAIYIAEMLWGTLHSSIINGVGKLKIQLYSASIATIINIPLAVFMGHKWGLEGIVLSVIIINSVGPFLQKIQVNRILNNTASGIWNK